MTERAAKGKTKRVIYDQQDVGSWIDGTYGEQHALQKMADMLGEIAATANEKVSARANELLREYDDDEVEDEFESEWLDDATEVLEDVTAPGLCWEWDGGDLLLTDECDDDED